VFTGIITEAGKVAQVSSTPGRTVIKLVAPEIASLSAIGDSVSVNGACLTVVALQGADISFDVSNETLKSTNLGRLKKGDIVNLEP
jgi:riboflavin synthase